MTALPDTSTLVMPRLLTIKDYLALGESDQHRTELQEGSLVIAPGPGRRHQRAMTRLAFQLHDQLPAELELVVSIDIDLDLAPADQPGTCRRPDLIVVDGASAARVDADDTIFRASDVLVIVEIVSKGSKRTDTVIKRGEYADAGIPHYWIIDLESPPSLLACHLAAGSYQDGGAISGVFATSEPFEARIDLDQLT